MKFFSNFERGVVQPKIDNEIESNTRQRGHIIYGAKALFVQLPTIHTRETRDYDIFASNPKRAATQLEKRLDRKFGGDYFYVKPAKHKGTYKVMDYGRTKSPKDDQNIADYTTKPKKIRTVTIGGIRYAHTQEVIKSKRKALQDKKSEFRHQKDISDINLYKRARRF